MKKCSRVMRYLVVRCINTFLCGTRFFGAKKCLLSIAGIKCGEKTKIVGPLYLGNVADVSFGNNVWVGAGFSVYGNGTVIIGSNVDIAPEVAILTGSHKIAITENFVRRAGEGIKYQIKISDGCWIGARSTIMGNTVVGRGAVIAAGALVNKNVESDTLYGGVPAKIIRKLI